MSVMNKFMNFLGLQEEEELVERTVETQESETNAQENRKNKNNVVSLHTAQKNSKLVLCEPRSYDETPEIADHLRNRRAVLVNLQRVRSDQAMRIVDFLSGTVYALSGTIARVGTNIFICTPDNVEVQGAITEMMSGDEETTNSR